MAGKNPKAFGGIPAAKKTPREEPAQDLKPVWRFARIDFGGPWCPKSLDQTKLCQVIAKLGQLETQLWPDLIRHGCHFVETYKLTKEARDRLTLLKLDDVEALYSIRLSGANRVWGLKLGNVFLPLWWDPDHQICPSLKN